MKSPSHAAAVALLSLPAWLYGCALRLRERRYRHPKAITRGDLPVISVGNLTVGGTGKTPMVAWLAGRLLASGRRPAIVSRGYRGRAGRGPLVVSRGRAPLCHASLCGDEPYLLAKTLEGAVVIVGSDRVAAVAAAAREGAEVAILDDGFQHRRLARDLDIVLLDARNPFGHDRLLPAGSLREPLGALGRADVIVVTRAEADEPLDAIVEVVRRHNASAPLLRSRHATVGFFDERGNPVARPERAVAFCGIGNPERFRRDLEALGVGVVAFRAYRDHHAYTAVQIRELYALAARHAATLVTTEKDLVRLEPEGTSRDGAPSLPLVLRIEMVLEGVGPLLERVGAVLARSRP